jgi:hypothetical protein
VYSIIIPFPSSRLGIELGYDTIIFTIEFIPAHGMRGRENPKDMDFASFVPYSIT